MTTENSIREQSTKRRTEDVLVKAKDQVDWDRLDAILVDLDGVVTETARVHARAWKKTFDEYLKERASRRGGTYHPFDLKKEYKNYVDGKPRYDGVASFLQSREIYIPPGEVSNPPDKETVCGLGNKKNKHFLDAIRTGGVEVYATSDYPEVAELLVKQGIDSISLTPDSVLKTTMRIVALEDQLNAAE